jgi:hypothetical protein
MNAHLPCLPTYVQIYAVEGGTATRPHNLRVYPGRYLGTHMKWGGLEGWPVVQGLQPVH